MKNMKIGNKLVGENQPTFVIAEMACAHDGSLEKAKKLIDAAANAKVDAIQIHAFSTVETTAPYHIAYKGGMRLEFNAQQWTKIVEYAKSKGILISAIVQDMQNAKLMKKLSPDMFKIHSPDLSNPELIDFVARIKKPLIITVGASTFGEVRLAIKTAQKVGNKNLILMYGFQNYPTNFEKINLRLLKTLKDKFKCLIGYADHTDGDSLLTIILPIVSTQVGACILEKHITLNRAEKGTDHESALNPDEIKKFVEFIGNTEKALGDGIRHDFTEDELRYRELTKKSIVASRDIKLGERITRRDLSYLRAKPGLAPSEAKRIIGKRAKKNIQKFEVININDLR